MDTYNSECDFHTECKKITDCKVYGEYVKTLHLTNAIGHRNFLLGTIQRSICGFVGKIPKICCPTTSSNKHREILKNDNNKVKQKTNHSVTENCGNFIWSKNLPVDGGPTDLYEFPWLALLQYKNR